MNVFGLIVVGFLEAVLVGWLIDTKKVEISLKRGLNYANTSLRTLDALKSADGRYIDAPQNAVFEIKFPGIAIKGAIR